MSLYRDKAVVLRNYDLREADRIIVMMTENHGKVRAIAKGVRKTFSKFGARLEPLSHIDVLLSTSRKDLDIVSQVDLVSSARGLYTDLDRLTRGLAMLEAVDQLGMDREPTVHLYKMLVGALSWLSENDSQLVLQLSILNCWSLRASEPMSTHAWVVVLAPLNWWRSIYLEAGVNVKVAEQAPHFLLKRSV